MEEEFVFDEIEDGVVDEEANNFEADVTEGEEIEESEEIEDGECKDVSEE